MSWISRAGIRRIVEGVGFDAWDFFAALVDHQRPEWNLSPLATTLPNIETVPAQCRVLRHGGTQWHVTFNGGSFVHIGGRDPFIGVVWQGNDGVITFTNVDAGQTITGLIFGLWHRDDPNWRMILGFIDDVAAPGGGSLTNVPITINSPGDVTISPNLGLVFRTR